MAQATGIERVLLQRHAVVAVLHTVSLQIQHVPRAEQIEEVLERVATGRVRELEPDGVFLSNGPGDPAAVFSMLKAVLVPPFGELP